MQYSERKSGRFGEVGDSEDGQGDINYKQVINRVRQ